MRFPRAAKLAITVTAASGRRYQRFGRQAGLIIQEFQRVLETIAATLGVARSNIVERKDAARRKRGPQTRVGDVELAADIRRLSTEFRRSKQNC
jgi:hypothetical protein